MIEPFIYEDENNEVMVVLEAFSLREREENALYFILAMTLLAIPHQAAITAVIAALLGLASYWDLKEHALSNFLTLAITVLSLLAGIKAGRICLGIVISVAICIYDVIVSESDVFGSADFLVLAGLLSFFGFSSWLIMLILACLFGIVLKLVLWGTKKDKREDRHLPFIPGVALGSVITYFIDHTYGHFYKITIEDLIWVIQTLF